MNETKFCLILATTLFFALQLESAIYTPLLHQPHHGPLYEGVKLLIADEKFNAELLWNETSHHINTTIQIVTAGLETLLGHNATIRYHLAALNSMQKNTAVRKCYKQHEREVAHFNRAIIRKYRACQLTMQQALAYLINGTRAEITTIQNAATDIESVAFKCKIGNLRQDQAANQAGSALCVVARIGEIDQRLLESSRFCLDIVADISRLNINSNGTATDDDVQDSSCNEFLYLKTQLESVYQNIIGCAAANGKI